MEEEEFKFDFNPVDESELSLDEIANSSVDNEPDGFEVEKDFSEESFSQEQFVNEPESVDDVLVSAKVGLMYMLDKNNIEYDNDTISAMTEQELADTFDDLAQDSAERRYQEIVSKDIRVKEIIDFIESGKDVKDLLPLLLREEALNNQDIVLDDIDKKAAFLYSYYEMMGYDEAHIEKKITRLGSVEGGIEAEVEDITPHYDKLIKSEKAKVSNEISRQHEQEEALFNKKQDELISIYKRDLLKKEDAQSIHNIIFNRVNTEYGDMAIIDAKILEMQKNPDMLYKLARFIESPEKYEKSIVNKAVSMLNEKQFAARSTSALFKKPEVMKRTTNSNIEFNF